MSFLNPERLNMEDKKVDSRFLQMKRNLKSRSKGELIYLLFEVHSYLEKYKSAYLDLVEQLKKKASEGETNESNSNDSSNVICEQPVISRDDSIDAK